MKTPTMYLDELTSDTKLYAVKVKVIEKGRPRPTINKKFLYQNLLIEDDKGNKMRAALFGDQIDVYKESLLYNGNYVIKNAPIRPYDDQWKTNSVQLNYQMSFGQQAIVKPLYSENEPLLPDYMPINQIPREHDTDSKIDVLGIVLYVEEEAREVTKADGRLAHVRELVITDHTTPQPLIITTWNDLALEDCNRIPNWAGEHNVAAFTALRPSVHKGFSLGSTMSTTITIDPPGDKTAALKNWASRNKVNLSDRQARVLDVRTSITTRRIIAISALRQKKAKTTLQDEKHLLQVTIPNADLDNIYAYTGCSNCSKKTEVPQDKAFKCSNCNSRDSIAAPRLTFTFEVTDGTGNLPLTAFTDDTAKLLDLTVYDIYKLKQMDDQLTFQDIQIRLRERTRTIEVGPKSTLTRNNVLQWILKSVEAQDETATSITTIQRPTNTTTTTTPNEAAGSLKKINWTTTKKTAEKDQGETSHQDEQAE